MLQVAKMPLARKLWRIAKALHIPVSEAGKMTVEELDFYDFSMLADDPKRLEQYENSYYDPDYESFEKAFDEEMAEKRQQETLMQEQERKAIEAERAEEAEMLRAAGYDVPVQTAEDEEWERVD